jgi:uncharacterized protein
VNWERFSLLLYFVRRVSADGRFGKKKFQKLVHMAQELVGSPFGFRFQFYTYGAFSSELASDIELLGSWKAIKIDFDRDANAYNISLGPAAEEIAGRGKIEDAQLRSNIDRFLDYFSKKAPKELELISTFVFVEKSERPQNGWTDDVWISRVLELKPKFSRADAEKALRDYRTFQ